MVRFWVVAALLLAGCAQPAAVAPTSSSGADVTCRLVDEGGAPLTAATCVFRFGDTVERAVDAHGEATLRVPMGASGLLSGQADGRLAAHAELLVDGPKRVTMTLPLTAPAAAQEDTAHDDGTQGDGAQEAARNGTEAPDAPENATEAPENATQTERYEGRIDQLLQEAIAVAPAAVDGVTRFAFTTEHDYDTVQVEGRWNAPVLLYAGDFRATLTDASGNVYMDESRLQVGALATGLGGGSISSFAIGFGYDMPAGDYVLTVTGAGAPQLTVTLTGYTDMAPDFTFIDLEGATRTRSEYDGKIQLIDLMATWCGPCQDAMPGLVRISEDYADDVVILSIDVDPEDPGENQKSLGEFRQRYGADWTFGLETQDSATHAFGTGWIPTFAVIDQHGALLYRHIGEMDEHDLREMIDWAIEER